MKKLKSFILTFLISCVIISGVSAKETQIATDVKIALQSYAGLTELNKRGFKLNDLDSAKSLEEVYNILLPYMVQNDISLDNAIDFYDKQNNKTYSFKQHCTVHFTDDFGSKAELKKKGYKDDEIFAYFSKGKDIYRGGKFVWEKAKDFPGVSSWNMPKAPPIVSDNFIYFCPLYYTEKFYPDYWEQASSKSYIILDMRLDEGGDYPISLFFDYLDSISYKGHVIIIIDDSSSTGEWVLGYRMTKWENDKEVQRSFTYTSIGENTPGLSNFTGNWQNYETDNFRAWGIRTEINKWKNYDEGLGVMPDIWAENSADICKTIEGLTGIKDISQKIAVYQDYIENQMVGYKYNSQMFFDSLKQLKDDKSYIEAMSKYEEIEKRWNDFCFENKEKKNAIEEYRLDADIQEFYEVKGTLPVNEFLTRIEKVVDESIKSAKQDLDQLRKDKSVPDHKLLEKEINDLYKKLGITWVDIPGKNIKMQNTEVTQKLFETIMGYNPSYKDFSNSHSDEQNGPDYSPNGNIGDNYPVNCICFMDAIYFCNKLSEKFGFIPVYMVDGQTDVEKWDYIKAAGALRTLNIQQDLKANGFRLPTAEEWRYAESGGENYEYAGSDNLNEVAWYQANSGYKLHPVAQKKPNGYGLYDMLGNVCELTWDPSLSSNQEAWNFRPTAWGGSYVAPEGWVGGATTRWVYSSNPCDGFRIVIPKEVPKQTAVPKKLSSKDLKAVEKSLVEIPVINIKMLKTELTQKLYASIMGENPSYFKGDDNPVENVSIYDAMCFCNKLSEAMGYKPVYLVDGNADVNKWGYIPHNGNLLFGKITQAADANGFRIPSEAEFMFAIKGGEKYEYAGSDNLDEVAWHKENSGNKTHPVAQKKPNAYGLYDMIGNVEEINSTSGLSFTEYERAVANTHQYSHIGFRVAVSIPQTKKKPVVKSNKETVVSYQDMKLSFEEIPGKKIWMLNTEVTHKLFESIMGNNPNGFPKKDNSAQDEINWYDAVYFCNKLSERFGLKPVYSYNGETDVSKWEYIPYSEEWLRGEFSQNTKADGFRLPTLEEWQYAAKGGENYLYAGSNKLEEVAWYSGNRWGNYIDTTSNGDYKVGLKKPNGYGLYDMSGNVAEWVWDSGEPYQRYACGSGMGFDEADCRCDSAKTFGEKVNWLNNGLRIVCPSSTVFKKKYE